MRVIEPDYELVFVHDKTTVDKQAEIIEHNVKKEPIGEVKLTAEAMLTAINAAKAAKLPQLNKQVEPQGQQPNQPPLFQATPQLIINLLNHRKTP
jgi:hypothetical protein